MTIGCKFYSKTQNEDCFIYSGKIEHKKYQDISQSTSRFRGGGGGGGRIWGTDLGDLPLYYFGISIFGSLTLKFF